MTSFADHCVGPADPAKKPKQLVIFLHGYGSNGQEMARYMGPILSPMLPEAKLVFMTAPDFLGTNDDGLACHSWFKVDDMLEDHKADKAVAATRVTQVVPKINAQIDAIIKREGMRNRQVVIAGFSQGATTAFYAGLMRDKPVAGVFSMSGGALDQIENPKSKPPVCLVIGGKEQLPYNGEAQNKDTLKKLEGLGIMSVCEVIPEHGHDISKRVMELLSVMVNNVTSRKFRLKYHFDKIHKEHKGPHKPHTPRFRHS